MIDSVLTLFKTFWEMILFRKGPNDIPESSFLLTVVVFLWLVVGFVAIAIIESYKSSALLIDLALAIVGLGFYAIAAIAFGQSARLTQCFTALLGCSVVFSILLFGGRLVFPLLLKEDEVNLAVQIVWLWSIPVEGHIIARTIDRQWIIGFLIAVAVLFAQLQIFAVFKPMFDTAT